jgi:hypothetical protein
MNSDGSVVEDVTSSASISISLLESSRSSGLGSSLRTLANCRAERYRRAGCLELGARDARFHTRIVPPPPVMTFSPSGLTATAQTSPVWPAKVVRCSPLRRLKTRAVPS